MAKITQEQRELAEAMVKANDALLEGSEKFEAIQNRISLNLKEQLDFVKLTTEEQFKLAIHLKKRIDTETDPTQLTFLKNKLKLLHDGLDATEVQIEATLKLNEANKKLAAEQRKLNKEFDSAAQHLKSLAGLGDTFADTTLGKMATAMGGVLSGTRNLGAEFKKLGGQVLGAVSNATTGLWVAQDQLRSGFLKTTGASTDFADALISSSNELRAAGLNMENAAHATQSLFHNVTAFKGASQETRVELITLTSTLMDLGVSSEATAGALQIMTQSLGLSASDAADLTENIALTARSLDMDMNRVMQDFVNVAPNLTQTIETISQEFLNLERQARATGLGIDKLVSLAETFDTFEGATRMVSQLNAAMGANLDAHELMLAPFDERNEMIKEGIGYDAEQFRSLGRMNQIMIKNILGMNSLADVSAFLNKQTVEQTESQKSAAELATQAQSVMEKLKITMQSLAVAMEPVIDVFKDILDVIVKLNKFTGGWFGKLALGVGVIFTISKAMKAFRLVTLGLAAAQTTLNLANAGGGATKGGGILGGISKIAKSPLGLMGRMTGLGLAAGAVYGGLKYTGVLNEGGTIPQGGVGLVGDGPGGQVLPTSELVTGPATVTPLKKMGMGGLSNSAVDRLGAVIANAIAKSNTGSGDVILDGERVGRMVSKRMYTAQTKALKSTYPG
jgi:hypothetical protein